MFSITARSTFARLLAPGAAFAVALGTLCPHAMAQCNGRWLPAFGQGGPDDIVYASIVWDPDGDGPRPEELVIGGRFSSVGGVPANRIAAWDGIHWSPLGGGII